MGHLGTLCVMGAGKTGKALSRLFLSGGVYSIHSVVNRTYESSRAAALFIGAPSAALSLEDICGCSCILLSVPDDAVASCAADIAKLDTLRKGTVAFHCSGFLSSAALAPLADRGCLTASIHPVKSFSNPSDSAESFAGTPVAIEGSPRAVEVLTEAFTTIGGQPFRIKPESKPLYHAATVFLSNYVVALLHSAGVILDSAGVDAGNRIAVVRALAAEAVSNVLRSGAAASLTGPVSRGDVATVRDELAALNSVSPDQASLYRELGRVALSIACANGTVSGSAARELSRCFSNETVRPSIFEGS